MKERIAEFIAILRRNGLRISLAEQIDLFRALDIIDPTDPRQFKAAFSATIVKSKWDQEVFNRLYHLYFYGLTEVFEKMTDAVVSRLFENENDFEEFVGQLAEAEQQGLFGDLDALSQALLVNDQAKLQELLRAAAMRAGISEIRNFLQQGRFTLDILTSLGFEGAGQQMRTLSGMMEGLPGHNIDLEKVNNYIAGQLQGLNDAVRNYVQKELEKFNMAEHRKILLDDLEERSFVSFSRSEIERMNDVLVEMARKLKDKISYRRKKMKHGRFSVQRTLRANQRYDGVPFKIVFDDREIDKPSVVVLCDISDSVRNASRFMLQFVYLLQDLFDKVRSFVFVEDLGEITHLFREREINDAIDYAYRGQIINVRRRSDYGNSFVQFNRDYSTLIDRRTSVIILGDGRNNYREPKDWALGEISRKSRAVLWLNPESPSAWNFGDSVMWQYSKYCRITKEVRNLRQLREFVDRLVLRGY
jgi:uncharacterized protein